MIKLKLELKFNFEFNFKFNSNFFFYIFINDKDILFFRIQNNIYAYINNNNYIIQNK